MENLNKNIIPTFNLLLQACAGAKSRQKCYKLLEVEPIQHPQEPLMYRTKQLSITNYQGTTPPWSHNSLAPAKTLNVAWSLAISILRKSEDIFEMEESGWEFSGRWGVGTVPGRGDLRRTQGPTWIRQRRRSHLRCGRAGRSGGTAKLSPAARLTPIAAVHQIRSD